MKLYKYISFDKDYWKYPLEENRLYFSNLDQLRQLNDPDEFLHHWETDSHFFQKFSDVMRNRYNELFSNVRVLCLSKRVSKTLWNEYCGPSGGVCYEFDFDSNSISRDITSRNVKYVNSKYTNVPQFVIRNTSGELRRILRSREMNPRELPVVMQVMKSGLLTDICVDQIQNEIAFKKINRFRYEHEYRMVHPENTIYPNVSIITPFQYGKIEFQFLGLKLNRVITSDPQRIGNFSGVEVKAYS